MDPHDCLHFLTLPCRSFCPTRQHKDSLDVDVPYQSTKKTNPPPSDTLTWTLTRSPLAFWAPRASRTLSLAEGLCLGQGAEEQERRARSRHRAPNIARPPQALLGTSPDPSACGPCLREPSLLLASSGPQPCPQALQSPPLAPFSFTGPSSWRSSAFPHPERAERTQDVQRRTAKEKAHALSSRDTPQPRVASKLTRFLLAETRAAPTPTSPRQR